MYFSSGIDFSLKSTQFIVSDKSGKIVEKKYSESLIDEEIEILVNGEIRRHKEAIEKRIEETRSNPKHSQEIFGTLFALEK